MFGSTLRPVPTFKTNLEASVVCYIRLANPRKGVLARIKALPVKRRTLQRFTVSAKYNNAVCILAEAVQLCEAAIEGCICVGVGALLSYCR